MNKIAVIVYGDGGGLGNFKVFADSLHKELLKKYTKIVLKYVNRDTTFFDVINSVDKNDKIEELHIFSHSLVLVFFRLQRPDYCGQTRSCLVGSR